MTKKIPNEYAVYLGDEFICMGTAEYCAKQIGVRKKYIYHMLTKSYQDKIQNRIKQAPVYEVVKIDMEGIE